LTQFPVQRGDSLRVSVAGLYSQQVTSSSFAFSLAAFVAGLLQPAPAGAPPRADGSRRGGLPLLQVGLNASALAAIPKSDKGVPQGYLRVLVFTQDSVLLPDQCRLLPLTTDARNNYQLLQDTLSIRQNGYVSVYVGNESPADVYFDELRIEHHQGLQVQENQYDPWGLGVSGAAPGLRLKNFYQFNGKENQLDLGLNWNHQDWRFLDYQIGRWHAVDQLAEKWHMASPYAFASNNPVLVADPDGRDNIIYLQAQKSSEQDLSRKELRGIVRQANANFKTLGLETRVRLSKGPVSYNKLDKIDAVAVIGRGTDVIKTVDGMSKIFGSELKETGFGDKGSSQVERSQNGGNIIAIDSRAVKAAAAAWQETPTAVGGFVINHGAGHNAGLNHGGTDQQTRGAGLLRVPYVSVMTDGSEISKSVMRDGWDYTPGLNGFVSDPSNQHGIIHQSYLYRFGNHPAKATLPTSD
jgi:RHS repeat-associated protein